MNQVKIENKIITFEVLRIIAAFIVIMLHVTNSRFIGSFPSSEWNIRNIYDAFVRWGVPVFVMISGALFLNLSKSISIKRLYTKNVLRIVSVFIFWALVYAPYDAIENGNTSLLFILGLAIHGEYHLWFLKMLLGLYVAVPILRMIVQNKRIEEYFIVVAIITAFAIPMIITTIGVFSETAHSYAEEYYDEFGMNIAAGYLGYFVLGHYLTTYQLNLCIKRIIYIFCCVSVVLSILFTYWSSHHIGEAFSGFYSNLSLFVLFEALTVFLFVNGLKIRPRLHPFIIKLSSLTLGVYLVHVLVLRLLNDIFGINSITLNPSYFIFCFSLAVFVISCLIVALIKKIPILKKFVM